MLRGQVVAILSASGYSDGRKRYEIRFENCEPMYNKLRIPEGVINTTHPLKLDEEIVLDTGAGAAIHEARAVGEGSEREANLKTIKVVAEKARKLAPSAEGSHN